MAQGFQKRPKEEKQAFYEQLVKSDLEAAINGKQWPLSCFGPFKDKPCVPGFIEDQSFDEIRWICYESRQKNCFDQFVQQFNKEAMEANNKIKTMAQISPQVIDTICRLYDASSDIGGSVSLTKSNSDNPFDRGIRVENDTASIFNKYGAASSGNKNFGDVLLGGMAPSTSGDVFGGGGSAFNCQNQQSSVFSQQIPNTNSLFGDSSKNPLFGQTLTSTAITVGPFGQAPQGTGGLFAQASQEQRQTQHSSNVGLFSVPTQTPACDSLFNQGIQKQHLTNGGNGFSQSIQSQQMQIPSSYNMYPNNNQQTASAFAQSNAFSQHTSSVFSQTAQSASSSNINNLFSRSLSAANTGNNTLTVPSQNVFAQALRQNQETSANIFSQTDRTIAATSVSMQPTSFFQQETHSQSSPTAFGQHMGENGTSQNVLLSSVGSISVYSKLADLTTDEIEAFKATAFTPRKIPNIPPPLELV